MSLSYWIECSVTNKGETFAERIVLQQDDRDRQRQEYIDTHKASLPSYDSFRWTASQYFPKSKFRSFDYTYFLIDQTFLDSLDATYLDYRSIHDQPLEIYTHTDERGKAYLSPNALFTYKPTGGIGLPSYYEDDAESPHIYGLAVDLQVVDYPPEGLIDDWGEIAQLLTDHGINFFDTGDYSYVHAEYHFDPPPEQMIEVTITPNLVEPGYGSDLVPNLSSFKFRTCSVTVEVASSLQPYSGLTTLWVEEIPYSGGHNHIGRPLIRLPEIHHLSPDSLTSLGGDFTTAYHDTCKYGGNYRIVSSYVSGFQSYIANDTLSIYVPGLVVLPESTAWEWTGNDTLEHTNNHYIYSGWEQNFRDIVSYFYELCEGDTNVPSNILLKVNDISLPRGGLYDYNLTWHRPHQGHRAGYSGDLSFNNFNVTHPAREYLIQACRDEGGRDPVTDYDDHIHCYFCTVEEKNWP